MCNIGVLIVLFVILVIGVYINIFGFKKIKIKDLLKRQNLITIFITILGILLAVISYGIDNYMK